MNEYNHRGKTCPIQNAWRKKFIVLNGVFRKRKPEEMELRYCKVCGVGMTEPASIEKSYMDLWDAYQNVICEKCIDDAIDSHIMSVTHEAVTHHMENNGGRY